MRTRSAWLTLTLCTLLYTTPAQAVTPMCTCSATEVQVTLDDALSCFVVEEELDVCYGDDVVIQVNNGCAFDLIVRGEVRVDGTEAIAEAITAQSEWSWQEVFLPRLSEESAPVSMSWTIEAEGAEYPLSIDFVGSCSYADEGDHGEGGCNASGASPLWALLLSALIGLWAWRRVTRSRV